MYCVRQLIEASLQEKLTFIAFKRNLLLLIAMCFAFKCKILRFKAMINAFNRKNCCVKMQ